jgi:hypothetical protein
MWPIHKTKAMQTNTSTKEPTMMTMAVVICFFAARAAAFSCSLISTAAF